MESMYALAGGFTGASKISTFHRSPDGSDDGLAGAPPHAMHTSNTAPQNDAEPECSDEKARKTCTGNHRIRKIGTRRRPWIAPAR